MDKATSKIVQQRALKDSWTHTEIEYSTVLPVLLLSLRGFHRCIDIRLRKITYGYQLEMPVVGAPGNRENFTRLMLLMR